MIDVFGRLKPGVQQAQAEASLKTIAARLEREYPADNRGRTIELSSLSDAALGFLPREQMVIAGVALTAVVGLVLLIACANLANLLLARSAKRAREMGIRTALGAERCRLIRQLLTENLLLSFGGGMGGLLIGLGGSELLWSFRPVFLGQNSIAIQFDWRVFAFRSHHDDRRHAVWSGAGAALLTFGLERSSEERRTRWNGIVWTQPFAKRSCDR